MTYCCKICGDDMTFRRLFAVTFKSSAGEEVTVCLACSNKFYCAYVGSEEDPST